MSKYLFLLFVVITAGASAQEVVSNWFPFKPGPAVAGSRIDMQGWLHRPAGKHGPLQGNGSSLRFADGTPVKFWGVNIASDKPFVEAAAARRWVRFMAGYGINAVRFHKFTWEATDGVRSTQLTAGKWRNFDYFCSQLKAAGIYYAWSHIYGHRVRPADSSRLLAYSEVAGTRFPWAHLNGTTASLVNFADDLQALNIELTVNMLKHRNPVTGLRYADDPALACIELQNEDNIFWSAIEESLKQAPTYRALLCRKFSRWLKDRYGSQQALETAWGANVLPAGESLAQENIYPQPNHGLFAAASKTAWERGSPIPPHIVDKAFFLFEQQDQFYQRFVQAIRQTGYKGLIVGSCWQAGSGLAHLLNLYSDYRVGPIDRHNYFGGGTGHTLRPGKVVNGAMVNMPGSGLLSTGFQQVADRPFFISEWMSLIPSEWTAESAPLIATYGMGLQGWDASFAFAMDYDHFTPTVQSGHGVYNVTSPTQLALYPALAAMLYRGDVHEGQVVANRKVSVGALRKGIQTQLDIVEQERDVKDLRSSVPLPLMARGRVVLSFDSAGGISLPASLRGWDSVQGVVQSNTGQLRWQYGDSGYFVINTPGTQGVVGFAQGKQLQLGNVSIRVSNPFAVVLVSSMHSKAGIAGADRILVTAIARARNTGMRYNAGKTELEVVGEAPILLEPVQAVIDVKRKARYTVHALDHSGNRTGLTLPVRNGRVVLDGARYKTIYYELVRH